MTRIALGLSFAGTCYQGWQSQPSGQTVQDQLERALRQFATQPLHTLCAGRTDAGVHGLMQVVHFDTTLQREPFSWVRGTNRYLPPDIAVQWAQAVPDPFHARASATGPPLHLHRPAVAGAPQPGRHARGLVSPARRRGHARCRRAPAG
jgi:tRNA pseudouridine38-40 synthase